jgi:hypothetical protein
MWGEVGRTGESYILVTKLSATNTSKYESVEDAQPIQADHSTIVKFKHELDPAYLPVARRIRLYVASAPDVIRKRFPRTLGL